MVFFEDEECSSRVNNSNGECADDDNDDGCPYGAHLFPPAIFNTMKHYLRSFDI